MCPCMLQVRAMRMVSSQSSHQFNFTLHHLRCRLARGPAAPSVQVCGCFAGVPPPLRHLSMDELQALEIAVGSASAPSESSASASASSQLARSLPETPSMPAKRRRRQYLGVVVVKQEVDAEGSSTSAVKVDISFYSMGICLHPCPLAMSKSCHHVRS